MGEPEVSSCGEAIRGLELAPKPSWGEERRLEINETATDPKVKGCAPATQKDRPLFPCLLAQLPYRSLFPLSLPLSLASHESQGFPSNGLLLPELAEQAVSEGNDWGQVVPERGELRVESEGGGRRRSKNTGGRKGRRLYWDIDSGSGGSRTLIHYA